MPKIGSAFLTWRRYLQKGFASYGITLKQYYLLGALSRADFLYPSDIAGRLYCDRPTATVVIRNMERAGWIRGRRDPDDGKRKRIVITEAGRRKRWAIAGDGRNPERLFSPESCFSDEELERFAALLDKLASHLAGLPGGEGGAEEEDQDG